MGSLPVYFDEQNPTYLANASRIARYNMLYALWRNDPYSGVGQTDLINNLGLYKFIRGLYNPAFRLAAFYGQYVYSGVADLAAGAGTDIPSSLPIVTESEQIRKYIAKLMRNSNLLRILPVIPEWGSRDGDVFIAVDVRDDGTVNFDVLRPTELKEIEFNDAGLIVRYKLERKYYSAGLLQTYIERGEVADNGEVRYETSDTLGAKTDRWIAKYRFIPIVHIAHGYTGLVLGSAAIRPSLIPCIELDDSASKLFDQVRKMVNPAWLLSGVRKPTKREQPDDATERDVVGNQFSKVYYSNDSTARAWPLITDLHINDALENLKGLLDVISLNHPELKVAAGLDNASGDISGRAFITSRTSASQNIANARASYDDGIRRLVSMAWMLTERGTKAPSAPVQLLDFVVGDRPVFPSTEAERLDLEKAWLINAGLAGRMNVSLATYMRMVGKSPELVALVEKDAIYEANLERMTSFMGSGFDSILPNRAGEDSFSPPNSDISTADPNLPFGDFSGN